MNGEYWLKRIVRINEMLELYDKQISDLENKLTKQKENRLDLIQEKDNCINELQKNSVIKK